MLTELQEDNLAQMVASNQKVVVQYMAAWCGNCRIMKPKFKKLASENENMEFVLVDAPKGISLASFEAVKGGLVLELRADPEATEEDLEDNLIVEAIQQREFPGRDGRPTVRRKYSVGHLPAIPITVR